MLRVLERELQDECCMLALVDDASARVLCSTAVPLQHLSPGAHFNLKLALPGGAALYVTLCLEASPRQELARWQALQHRCASFSRL